MKQIFPFKHSNNKAYNWIIYYLNYRFLSRFIPNYRGQLYDLGCGEAPYRAWLSRYVDRYIGVDWGACIHGSNADLLADLNQPLPIEDAVADTVLSLSVMEHLRDPQQFLSEAYRILKPGGTMVLQVPFMWSVHEAPYDYYRYTRFGLDYMFHKAGFRAIDIYAQTGFWTMWTLKFNYQLARLVRGPWFLRALISLPMLPIWTINQVLAPLLDRFWPGEGETAGYFVVATKS